MNEELHEYSDFERDANSAAGQDADQTSRGRSAGETGPAKQRRPYRGRHDGSIHFDAKRGFWRGSIMLEGKRYQFSGKTEASVKRQIADKRKEFYDWSLTEPNRLTVQQVVMDWLENVVKKRRRPSTYSQYESPLRVYFLPRFGSKPVRAVDIRTLERFYAELEEGQVTPHFKLKPDGTPWRGRKTQGGALSPKSIRNLHTAIHAAFARAVRHRRIPRNPADGVELPTLPRRRRFDLDVEDIQRLLHRSKTENDPNYALWVFLAHTGLRIGEALALRWANVDLAGGWFFVEEDLERGGEIGDPKTEAGEREIPLTSAALEALRDHREEQDDLKRLLGAAYDDRDLVFPTATGRPNSERNALRSLKRLAKRARIEVAVTLHDFRRMTASILVTSGVDITTAASILGHKRASVLLDIYAKALRAPKRAAAEKVQAVLHAAPAAESERAGHALPAPPKRPRTIRP